MNIVILGLSITSSWGNGHATTYRGLLRELTQRGHHVLFLEREQPWYAAHRDLPQPGYCEVHLYRNIRELKSRYAAAIAEADCVMVGSFVPEGIAVIDWVLRVTSGVVAFYDIDTPVTLEALEQKQCEYLAVRQIQHFDLYLSFTGGPTLRLLKTHYGARRAAAMHCSVDPATYRPLRDEPRWDLGYLGTFSADRQPALERLLLEPARANPHLRMVVAGSLYPAAYQWPPNVERIAHLSPDQHAAFYNAQRFTLNLTRAAMIRVGYSPSVRLFEAAACGVPIISDAWPGLETFFVPGEEILVASSPTEMRSYLCETNAKERAAIAQRARVRVLREHTAECRAADLEKWIIDARCARVASSEEVAA